VNLFQVWGGFVSKCVPGALSILLLGVSAGRAETSTNSATDPDRPETDRPPVMSAWGGDSSSDHHQFSDPRPESAEGRWRFIKLFNDRGEPWNPWKKTLIIEKPPSGLVSDSGSRKISMPAGISDAALELQSIPMEDDVPAGSPAWDRGTEDTGLTVQFSESAESLAIRPPAMAAEARESGDSLDFSVPDTARGPSKVEFSSTDSESLHPFSSQAPGDQPGEEATLALSPPGPVPQIASPEPSVTALWGLSALLFACRRGLRSKSS
jgi:hypothetical protein